MVDLVRNTTTRFTSDPSVRVRAGLESRRHGGLVHDGNRRGRDPSQAGERDRRAPESCCARARTPAINSATTTLALSASPVGQDARLHRRVVERHQGRSLDAARPGAKPVPLIEQDFDQSDGQISPDGRWIAYVSNESGSNEVFVRSLSVRPLAPGARRRYPRFAWGREVATLACRQPRAAVPDACGSDHGGARGGRNRLARRWK